MYKLWKEFRNFPIELRDVNGMVVEGPVIEDVTATHVFTCCV